MVAELDLRAADERRIDRERRADLLPARALELPDESGALELAQLDRDRHARLRDPLPRVDEVAVCRGDRRNERDAVALEQEPQERTDRHGLVVRRDLERGGAPTERDSRVAERLDGRTIESLGDPVERDPIGVHGPLLRGEVEHGLGVAPRRGAAYGHRSGLLAGELRPGLVEGSFDELQMPLGRDLAPEHAARGEDDHRRELAAELRERLIVQLLRIGPTALADVVSLGLRLRAKIRGRRFRGFRRAVRDLLRLAPRLGEHRLGLGRQPFAFCLRRLRRGESFADALRAIVERSQDGPPEEAAEEIEEEEELDDRDEDPIRMHRERAALFRERWREEHRYALPESRMPSTNARMPSPSASAAPMIMFVRMTAAASGLRPIASDDFAVRIPTPMPGPRTPKPTAMPAASHARFIDGVPFCGIWSCGLRLRMRDLART